jgi:hydroxymethylglutaryl-CoA reductase
MNEDKKNNLSVSVAVAHLIVTAVGIGTILVTFGEKNAQLSDNRNDIDKLAVVVNDLAKAQASAAVADALHTRTLEDIQRRLEAIERNVK